ncbi:MAG TPA: Holliday junction branch migration protein RuvA [Bacillota bacterium]|nr:Holliday junction branch migration protein RuvA [Bacillota bacterium]
MIAYIKGQLVSINDDGVIVDVGGVGYEIICANPFIFERFINQDVKIHTFHHIREDAEILYGFKNQDAKFLFMRLISVSGIGPKSALTIQGNVDINDFVGAVEREDATYLTQFPGVGKKTARQIILDLKGKLNTFLTVSGSNTVQNINETTDNHVMTEAQEALKALGYTEREIKSVFPQLQKQNASIDEVIKKALALLMKN